MQQPHVESEQEDYDLRQNLEIGPAWRTALRIVWPAFLMAGVTEALVFSVVDPDTLHWFGGNPIEWSRQSIYSVSFFLFWVVISVACALTYALTTVTQDLRIGR